MHAFLNGTGRNTSSKQEGRNAAPECPADSDEVVSLLLISATYTLKLWRELFTPADSSSVDQRSKNVMLISSGTVNVCLNEALRHFSGFGAFLRFHTQ